MAYPQVSPAGHPQQTFPSSKRAPSSPQHYGQQVQYGQQQVQYGGQQYRPQQQYAQTVDPWSSPRVKTLPAQKLSGHPDQVQPVGYVNTSTDPHTGERYHERVIQEGSHKVFEKVIEMPKRVVQEKIIEVPEFEYITKIVEVPEVSYVEKVVEKYVEVIQHRPVPVQRPKYVEKIIEVPQIEYIDVPVERIVEVPEYVQEVVVRNVEVPQYVEVPFKQVREVPVQHEVERHLPVPVEVTATFEYRMPCIRPVYKEVPVPIYVPRYIEVPVPAHLMDPEMLRTLDDRVNQLARNPHTSLQDLQGLADQSRGMIPT